MTDHQRRPATVRSGDPRKLYGYPDSWLGIDRRRDMLEEVLDRLTQIEDRLDRLTELIRRTAA